MNVTREFLVSATVTDFDEYIVTTDEIQLRLNASYSVVGYDVTVTSVVKYDPENLKDRYGIAAIKRIREITGCGLVEGKTLIDLVNGNQASLKWRTVEVTYVSHGVYRVIDNR